MDSFCSSVPALDVVYNRQIVRATDEAQLE